MLEPDRTKRLGVKGVDEIKNHPFFKGIFFLFECTLIWLGIDWDVLLKSKAPIIPVTENDIDVSNFEKESKKFHESELESPFLDRSPVRSSYNLIVNIE